MGVKSDEMNEEDQDESLQDDAEKAKAADAEVEGSKVTMQSGIVSDINCHEKDEEGNEDDAGIKEAKSSSSIEEVIMEDSYLCDDVGEADEIIAEDVDEELEIYDNNHPCDSAEVLGARPSIPFTLPPPSPIYSTVEPSHLRRSKSSACDGETTTSTDLYNVSTTSATYGSVVVSYTSTMALPLSGHAGLSKSTSLDWLPRVPKKQRCVQVSVMDEDFRTPKREMLFVDISGVTTESRGLIFVNTAGDMVYRTCHDVTTGAYGVVLEDSSIIGADKESKRIVGCLFNTESTAHRDEWELRDAETGDINAVIKLGKWQGFVKGCMHVHRGKTMGKGADIRIRRIRGSTDFVVEATLNGQIITTIRRGAGRGSALDHNIFSLFVAPYIDSVAIVSVFTCLMHIQLRHDRPRTTTNIIGMLLAKEARQTGREIKSFTAAKTEVIGKVVKKSVKKSIKVSSIEIKKFITAKTIKIGTLESKPSKVSVPIPVSRQSQKDSSEKLSTSKQTSVQSRKSATLLDVEKVYIKVAKSAEKNLYQISKHAEVGVKTIASTAQKLTNKLKEKHSALRERAAAQLATG